MPWPVSDSTLRRQGPVILALVIGLSLTGVAFFAVKHWERHELSRAVEQVASGRVEALRGHLIRSMEVLHSIESFYAARPEVAREEFRAFVSGAISRQPELQGLAWDPRVPDDQREQWEAKATAEGLAEFRFSEQKTTGGLVPASERSEYFPVFFMESVEKNNAALGFDVASEENRRKALEHARDSGQPTATAPIRLAQEPASQLGFLVFLPIYTGAPATLEQRRAALRGFAVAAFRIGDLVTPSLHAAAEKGLNVLIRDAASGTEVFTDTAGAPNALPSWQTSLEVAGRSWNLVFHPTSAFDVSRFLWQSWATLAAGLAITLLVAAYVFSHGRRVSAIEQRVLEATSHLHEEIAERRRAEDALRTAHDELESRVRDRTLELARSNEALRAEVAERQRAEAAAESANRAKSEFLANMSHEIRTPLNAIMGYSQILIRNEMPASFLRDALRTISSSSSHLLHIINEILDLSKIDAGRMELSSIPFDLVALAGELANMFQNPCEEKRIGLRIEIPEKRRSLPVVGDEGKLRQVLINLLGNAVKFTNSGCITLRILDLENDSWRFEVEDTGTGIPRELRQRIFDPFHQGSSDKGGTGLGLTIARRQVEMMGGNLDLESTPGHGSLFFFSLNLPPAGASEARGAVREIERLAPGYEVRALVVDDILENREVLSTMLALVGCEIILAENGRQAVEVVRVSRPDIVFMDMRLPEMDGVEATRRIVGEFGAAGIKVVATSASALEHERERYLSAGCEDFVAKPFRAERVYSTLSRLLDVEFTYREETARDDAPTAFDLAQIVLPEDLSARLVMAAELHSATVLKACLQELEHLGPECARLAGHLRGFLSSYDMEMIQRLVAQIPVQNSSSPASS